MFETKKMIDINANITNLNYRVVIDEGISKAIVSFDNLGYGTINAIKFKAIGYNSFNDVVLIDGNDSFYLIIQNIKITKNSMAKNLKEELPSNYISRLELEEYQICFDDGSMTTYNGIEEHEITLEKYDIYSEDKELYSALESKTGDKFIYKPKEYDIGWVCGCGRINKPESLICSYCDNKKEYVFKVTSDDFINKAIEEYRDELKEKQKEKQQEAIIKDEKVVKKKKIKNIQKLINTIVFILGLLLIFQIIHSVIISNRTTYVSESVMKRAVVGNYSVYRDGKIVYQLHVSKNSVTKRYCFSDKNVDADIVISTWHPRNGTFNTSSGDLFIMTKSGDIKYDGNTYKKGGPWTNKKSKSTDDKNSSLDDTLKDNETIYTALEFSDINVTTNSKLTICNGTVTNSGNNSYRNVRIIGTFESSSGEVLDTNWAFVIGYEGLAPGKSSTFTISVERNSKIKKCRISIYEFD